MSDPKPTYYEVDGQLFDPASVPDDDALRDAWAVSGGVVVVDEDKARALKADQIRRARIEAIRDLRVREDLGENVTAERTSVRAVDPDTAVAGKTPDQLIAFWPDAIERRKAPR